MWTGQAAETGEFPNVTVEAAGMCPSFKQEPVWRVCHRLNCRSRGHIVCKTLQYHLVPRSDAAPSSFPTLPGIRGDGARAYSKKSIRCSKMKTDKIVAIGLKRLKTVVCHCGITDREWPLKEALRKRNRDRHKPADRKRGMKC